MLLQADILKRQLSIGFTICNQSSLLCNNVQHIATHCNTLQHTVTLCNTLQHAATRYNTLQHTATRCNTPICNEERYTLQHEFVRQTDIFNSQLSIEFTIYNRAIYIAAHCNTLKHTATHCNTLQHTATHCNTQ